MSAPGTPRNPALTLARVSAVRGDRSLFEEVSVEVETGRLLRIEGANGAGKTTLLRMICGLSMPAEGEILWRGQPVSRLRDDGSLVYLGHAPALKGDLSALENLISTCGLAGHGCTARDAIDALTQAGLRGRGQLPTRVLSQGQRKRAALARLALSAACSLWVLDEPFDALDTAACEWLQRLLLAQLARGGVVVVTSHQPWPGDVWPAHAAIDLSARRRAEAMA